MSADTPTNASTTNQTTDRDDDTRFQLDLLAVIAGYESGHYTDDRHQGDLPHGLAIKDELDARYGTEVHHGRLYPNLDTLVHKGLVEKQEIDRRTNAYELTAAGHDHLAERAEWLTDCLNGDDADDNSGGSGADDQLEFAAGDITETEVLDAAEDHDTLDEVATRLDVSAGRARTLLVRAGAWGDVRDSGGDQA